MQRPQLHLVVPGICGPLADTLPLQHDAQLLGWIKTLDKMRKQAFPGHVYRVLQKLFGLDDVAELPTAALTLLAHDYEPGQHFYMHADPVHLQADMDHAIMTSPDDLSLLPAQARAFIHSINDLFRDDDFECFQLENRQWFVSTSSPTELQTTPLTEAIGRNVNYILPEGQHASEWKRTLTEIQMLLFSHDENLKREQSGLVPVNSVWFHGCGSLPVYREPRVENRVTAAWGDDTVLRGLCRHTGTHHYSLTDFQQFEDQLKQHLQVKDNATRFVIYLTGLYPLVNYSDVRPWLDQLQHYLNEWIYPILDTGKRLSIDVPVYPCHGYMYEASRLKKMFAWRQPAVESHISSYSGAGYSSHQTA